MNTPHKHAELIKAWADGAEIQLKMNATQWGDCVDPYWNPDLEYRIKPEPKPDIKFSTHIQWDIGWQWVSSTSTKEHNLKMTFDAKTGELKSAEVCK